MGAYENPQMIIPPDYGEIFRRNFEAGKTQVEAAYQRAEDRRNKIKAEQQRLDDKILAFDLQRMDIKAGDLTQSLQQQTTFLADDYAENERLYSEGKISREQYNSNRISSFRKLNEMKGLAGILTQQSKELQDVDLSDYQGGAVNGIGLMEAWKKGKIKFQYVGDEIEMYYKKGDELIAVDTQSLQEGEFFNINEKYAVSSEELKNIAGGKIIQPAHRQGQTFIGKDGKQYTRQQDQYADGVTNEEFAEDQINSYISNSKMQKLFNNNKDAGSIYMDTVFKTMVTEGEDNKLVLTTEGERLLNKTFVNLPKEEKEIIKQQIISGQYDKTNKANLDQISKRYVAEQSWNQVKGNLKSAGSVSQPTGSNRKLTKTEIQYNELENVLGVVGKENMTGGDLYNMINTNNEFKSNFGFATGQQLSNTGAKEDVEIGIQELIRNSATKEAGQRLRKELQNLPEGNFIFDMQDLANGKLTKLNEIDIYAKIIEESPAFASLSVREIRALLNNAGLSKSIKDGEDFSISAEDVEKSKKSLDPDFKKKLEDKAEKEKILSN
tara:strand:- start:5635 stop:7290 length:1656 start_codon:yes stop_codon:yes gene_type:complete